MLLGSVAVSHVRHKARVSFQHHIFNSFVSWVSYLFRVSLCDLYRYMLPPNLHCIYIYLWFVTLILICSDGMAETQVDKKCSIAGVPSCFVIIKSCELFV